MSITLRQLEIFIAVAETAQVTKASKKLFVTQSAVSMALAELENQLGGSLLTDMGGACCSMSGVDISCRWPKKSYARLVMWKMSCPKRMTLCVGKSTWWPQQQ